MKYTVVKQLDSHTQVTFEGESDSVEQALRDVDKLNKGELPPPPTTETPKTTVFGNEDVKVGDRIKIVDSADDRYWDGSIGTVVGVITCDGDISVNFDNRDYHRYLSLGESITVFRDEYEIIRKGDKCSSGYPKRREKK
jgi:hypothetical protein